MTPFLEGCDGFLKKFQASFRDTDDARNDNQQDLDIQTRTLPRLMRQIFASLHLTILGNQINTRLHNDVNDLLLTLHQNLKLLTN